MTDAQREWWGPYRTAADRDPAGWGGVRDVSVAVLSHHFALCGWAERVERAIAATERKHLQPLIVWVPLDEWDPLKAEVCREPPGWRIDGSRVTFRGVRVVPTAKVEHTEMVWVQFGDPAGME